MSTEKKQEESISDFLKEHKDEFLKNWQKLVEQSLSEEIKKHYQFSQTDFHELFNAYVNGTLKHKDPRINITEGKFIKQKIDAGCPLSIMSIINIHFMATAREMVRSVYPDAFNTRMEYLETLSDRVLNNEIVLFQYYEKYVSNLNAQLTAQTEALRQKNTNLIEFIDLATHQLQAPLWSILGFTSKLQRKYYPIIKEEGQHYLNRISANVAEMHQLIEDMTAMLLIDPESMKKRKIFLHDILNDSLKRIHSEIDNGFKILGQLDSVAVLGDPYHLRQCFFQIFKNSAQYTKGEKSGTMHVHYRIDDNLHIFFEDDGIGIEKEYRELVFKPLERLKEKEIPGTGMGLTLARKIIIGHKGSIFLEDSRYGGICVHITLPHSIIKKPKEGVNDSHGLPTA
jgi:signal transduction histidine kinase